MIIGIITDFGNNDNYIGVMKGVIKKINPMVEIIDINNNVNPQNIIEGAYNLLTAYPYYPDNTIFLTVIDPGVGTNRKAIVIKIYKQFLIAPDNGVTSYLLDRLDKGSITYEIREIQNKNFMLYNPSDTFHGRDIFSPVSAHLSNNPKTFGNLGDELKKDEIIRLPQIYSSENDTSITAPILSIDRFGNIITSLHSDLFFKYFKYNDRIEIEVEKQTSTPLPYSTLKLEVKKTFGDVKSGEAICYQGSSNFIEVGINQGNASKDFAINYHDKIKFIKSKFV